MAKKPVKRSGDFSALIAKAEEAVVDVKDARLREIAFERVLDHLLAAKATPEEKPSGSQTTIKKPTPPSTSRGSAAASGTLAWLSELHGEGFFKKPRSLKDILQELSNRSHILKNTDLTFPLQKLCHDKKLRRNQQAPAEGKPKVFHWYNW